MNLKRSLSVAAFLCLSLLADLVPVRIAAAAAPAGEKFFNFADQYVEIEAGMFHGASKGGVGIEVQLTPQAGWKLCASNSSSVRPLRLKLLANKCLKEKSAPYYPPPDLGVTDDSGAYSEYYTKTAALRQEYSRLKCAPQKKDVAGVVTVTYLLCQDNKCVGPFSREIKFRAAGK